MHVWEPGVKQFIEANLLQEAENGDLRPQFNLQAPAAWNRFPLDLATLEPILLERFFQLARPIADASSCPSENMRLQDAGHFFYLIETLNRLGFQKLEETLLMILDDFCQLDPRSYNELYLWCIVQLSRINIRYVEQFWSLAITLDLRYRAVNWRSPTTKAVYQHPYRLTDLIFYYYEIYTKDRDELGRSRYPSLGACLLRVVPNLTHEQVRIVRLALDELGIRDLQEGYGDALGLLSRFHAPT